MNFVPKLSSPKVRGRKENFFYFFRFSATIYPIEARFKAKALVITIEAVQNSKEQQRVQKLQYQNQRKLKIYIF